MLIDERLWGWIALYYVIACGVSWFFWSPLVLGLDGLKLIKMHPSIPVFTSLGTLGPFVAAYPTDRLQNGKCAVCECCPLMLCDGCGLVSGLY
jgi:hypothetical protein